MFQVYSFKWMGSKNPLKYFRDSRQEKKLYGRKFCVPINGTKKIK